MPQWTPADLKRQYTQSLANGWINLFAAAAAAHAFPVAFLMGIASRETNLRSIKGDMDKDGVYHGFGIMQVDKGTDPKFCASWTPEQVEASIQRGTAILANKRADLAGRGIRDSKAIASAYNTGASHVAASIAAGFDSDHTTTGKDYGADVMKRMAVFAELMGGPKAETT